MSEQKKTNRQAKSDAESIPPVEIRETPLPVKSEQAGLLWMMLPVRFRRRAAEFMTLTELRRLNQAFASYRRRSRAERLGIEKSLLHDTASRFRLLPGALFALLLVTLVVLFTLHSRRIPAMNLNLRLSLFAPLILGVCAPLALLTLPRYRLLALFRFRISLESASVVFFAFLGLLWTLFYIGAADRFAVFHPRGLSLLVVCAGAVTAPLLEEIFFRELLPGLFGRHPHYVGHLLAAVCFGLAHLPADGGMFFQYGMAALFLSLVRVQTGGLLYPYLIHSLANLIHQLLF